MCTHYPGSRLSYLPILSRSFLFVCLISYAWYFCCFTVWLLILHLHSHLAKNNFLIVFATSLLFTCISFLYVCVEGAHMETEINLKSQFFSSCCVSFWGQTHQMWQHIYLLSDLISSWDLWPVACWSPFTVYDSHSWNGQGVIHGLSGVYPEECTSTYLFVDSLASSKCRAKFLSYTLIPFILRRER